MRVNFLGAADNTPLSKTFQEIAPGNYKENSYPHVARFNSIERNVKTLNEFYVQTVACAKEGMCLLKGELDRPLINESRAGHTDSSAATSWLCLDVDYVVSDMTPCTWLEALGAEFKDVSFIFQYSASHKLTGLSDQSGWRGHFFILLESPSSPQALKQWLIQRNLSCISLQAHIGLSASGGALTYPLDVTTCQNDKLLYIAPPRCIDFIDPLDNRFELHQHDKDAVHLDLSTVNAATNQARITEKITELRATAGLKKKTFKTMQKVGYEVITNPDPVTVTGKKEERGFVYLNLNGGDSWGYYFPNDNPEILYNFKGEPCLYMRDVDKDIYHEYATVGSTGECVPFGFLWPNNDSYYRGVANTVTGELSWLYAVGSKAKLKDFLLQNGVIPPKQWAVDEWDMVFDPTRNGGVNFTEQFVNTYKCTDYMLEAKPGHTAIPPTIDRVLSSVCVNDVTKQHFLNWLASIFQTRQKTNTAWIFQGVQGTGKGILLTYIISPLIGRDYCHEMTMDRLDDDFNAYLSENLILFIDEAKISDSRNGERLLNRIKNLVTEPHQHIRGMHRNAVTLRNYSNIILASNYDDIITLEASDRRFNVAPRQEKPIQLDYEDIVTIGNELSNFADYLHSYAVDHKQVKQVILSDARDQLIQLSETTVDLFFHAISRGELEYFTQYLDHSIKSDVDGIRYHDYSLVVKGWIANGDSPMHVARDDLRMAYQYLQGTQISVSKFSRMCRKYGLKIEPVRIDNQVVRGVSNVLWQLSSEERSHHDEVPGSNVISMKEKK